MDRETFEDYITRFKATGLVYAKKERDRSGNATHLTEIPWEAALIRVMQDFQWVLVDQADVAEPIKPDPAPKAYGHLIRIK